MSDDQILVLGKTKYPIRGIKGTGLFINGVEETDITLINAHCLLWSSKNYGFEINNSDIIEIKYEYFCDDSLEFFYRHERLYIYMMT